MNDFYKFLQELINNNPELPNVNFSPLKDNVESVSMRPMPSSPSSEFFDREEITPIGVLFLSKRKYDADASLDLEKIIREFTKMTDYPQPPEESGIQWITATTGNTPSPVTQQSDGMKIYSCSLICLLNY